MLSVEADGQRAVLHEVRPGERGDETASSSSTATSISAWKCEGGLRAHMMSVSVGDTVSTLQTLPATMSRCAGHIVLEELPR
jgi:hypothetical protein